MKAIGPRAVGLTVDTGGLIALERGDSRVRALLRRASEQGLPIDVPAGVVAQGWRSGPRAARIARLLADPDVTVPVLDEPTARAVGLLCGTSGTSDVVGAHVVLHALERGHHIVTSDPDDLRRVHAETVLVEV